MKMNIDGMEKGTVYGTGYASSPGKIYDQLTSAGVQHPWEHWTRKRFVKEFPGAQGLVYSYFDVNGYCTGLCTLFGLEEDGTPNMIKTECFAIL